MTGLKKSCNTRDNKKIAEKYISNLSPYENRPPIEIDLLALTRYVKANNIKLEDMTEEELIKFKTVK